MAGGNDLKIEYDFNFFIERSEDNICDWKELKGVLSLWYVGKSTSTRDVMAAMIDLRSIEEIRVGSSPTVCITVFEILLKSEIQNMKIIIYL